MSSKYVDAKVVIDLSTANPRPAAKRAPGAKHSPSKAVRTARPSAARRTAKGRRRAPKKAAFSLFKALRPRSAKKKTARKARRNSANLRVLGLIWLLPVGIPLMWQRSCTWKKGVKLGVTAAALALVAALVLIPLPTSNRDAAGGVRMVPMEDEVEVYGPDLPSYIVPGYVDKGTESIIVDTQDSEVHYVYAADGAKCYHEYECKFAFASSQRLTVYEAYYLGFTPCGRCNPPKYDGKI